MRGDNETALADDATRSNSHATAAGLSTAAATATAAATTTTTITTATATAVGAPTLVGPRITAPTWIRHTNNGRAFYRRRGDDGSCTLTEPGGGVGLCGEGWG